MPSFFPPPGPLLPPFFSLLVTGAFHPSALLHLAIGHINESPENEVLILSPSRLRLEQKSASDEWLFSSAASNKARVVLSQITIIYPPSPVHFSLLITTLDGIQSSPELLSLWAEVPIIPTENLSMIIIDGISSYFEATDQAELSMVSLLNRVMQSISRISRRYHRTNPISLACFESTLLDPMLAKGPVQMHTKNLILPPNLISNHFQALVVQGEGAASNQKTRARKTLRLMPSQGETDGSIVVEYTEIVEGSLVRFVW